MAVGIIRSRATTPPLAADAGGDGGASLGIRTKFGLSATVAFDNRASPAGGKASYQTAQLARMQRTGALCSRLRVKHSRSIIKCSTPLRWQKALALDSVIS